MNNSFTGANITMLQVIAADSYIASLALGHHSVKVFFQYKGGDKITYFMYWKGKLVFSGDDYRPSPLHNGVESLGSFIDLLGFLTCQPGDTDDEYFVNYGDFQLQWCESDDCEQLKYILSDYEDKAGEGHNTAIGYFNAGYNTMDINFVNAGVRGIYTR